MSKFALSGEDGGAVVRLGWEKLGYVLEHGCGGAGGCVIEWREVWLAKLSRRRVA